MLKKLNFFLLKLLTYAPEGCIIIIERREIS
nr:MAG TPA: hypothetical protein [Caudoviricetes sp.]DAU77702.1 MAG TPA: hypothetical protein [Caudoviricetes sp.]